MAQGAVHEKLWTPANVVTLLRICLVPVFVVAIISPWPEYFPFWADAEASKPWIAAGIFILLAATDGLDGYLARSRGEVTNFGKFIDPLADKILVAAALLALIELGVLPSWVALVILTREFIVSGIRMVAASQGVVIAASWYGKAKTVAQIVAIVLFIVKDSVVITDPQGVLHNPLYLVSWLAMLIALALTVISMLDYFVKAKEILGFAPSGKRAPVCPVRNDRKERRRRSRAHQLQGQPHPLRPAAHPFGRSRMDRPDRREMARRSGVSGRRPLRGPHLVERRKYAFTTFLRAYGRFGTLRTRPLLAQRLGPQPHRRRLRRILFQIDRQRVRPARTPPHIRHHTEH